MTFKLNLDRTSEEENSLSLVYELEGKLPVDGYILQPIEFNFENRNFSVKYSITGNFVVNTDLDYLQTMNNRTRGLFPTTTTPIERLNVKLNRQISVEVRRMLNLLNNPPSTLDNLSD
jgi:hypothetical protein